MARNYYHNFPPPLPPRYTGEQITATWFDECPQDWPVTKEEESRMKQIDFAKPLCTVGKTWGHKGGSVEVVKEGLTLVRFTGELHVVDENGKIEGYAIQPGSGSLKVENVPEEPKDHLCIWLKPPLTGQASVDRLDGSQLQTKATWEKHFGARIGRDIILVQVPV